METIRNGQWVAIKWQNLVVGDIVRIINNAFFPADMVLLSSSEPQAMAFIETSNLDGETNLKIRQAVPATAGLLETRDLLNFNGTIECEPPNRHLYEFNGVLKERGQLLVLYFSNFFFAGVHLLMMVFVWNLSLQCGRIGTRSGSATRCDSSKYGLGIRYCHLHRT